MGRASKPTNPASSVKPNWVGYEDDGWYWLETQQEPFFSVAVSQQEDQFKHVVQTVRKAGGHVTELTGLYVKDPVHQYVQVPPPIAHAIQSPYVQRLRSLRQNGVGYLVFPSLQASRFEHSLGAMWLATRVCHHIFQGTTTPKVLMAFSEAILRDFQTWIKLVGLRLVPRSDTGPGQVSLTAGEQELTVHLGLPQMEAAQMTLARPEHLQNKEEEVRTIQVLAKHFVKLTVAHYALLHDIGHLPFSHTLEAPLETVLFQAGLHFPDTFYARKEESGNPNDGTGCRQLATWPVRLHERLSLAIIQGGVHYASDAWRRAVMLTHVAQEDFTWKDSTRPCNSIFATLHGLVSGDVDVDRLDFIARDGYESGAAFGQYDLDRVVRAAVIQRELMNTGDNGRFLITFEGHALRDIESVLLERAKLYNTIAFHHKVRFFDATLGLCLVNALAPRTRELAKLEKFFWPDCPHEDVNEIDPHDMGGVCFMRLEDCSGRTRHLDPTFLVRAERGTYGYFDDSALLGECCIG